MLCFTIGHPVESGARASGFGNYLGARTCSCQWTVAGVPAWGNRTQPVMINGRLKLLAARLVDTSRLCLVAASWLTAVAGTVRHPERRTRLYLYASLNKT